MFRRNWFGHFPAFVELSPTFDQMFESIFRDPANGAIHNPPINVLENEDTITIRAELPGVAAESLDIKVEDGVLTLSGRRQEQEIGPDSRLLRSERASAAFRRIVRLRSRVDMDGIEAHYDLGILTITLPKAAEAKPRRIEVKVNN